MIPKWLDSDEKPGYFLFSGKSQKINPLITNIQHCCYYAPSPYVSVFYTLYPVGDATLDGFVKTGDLLAVRKHIAELQILTGTALERADFNSDGAVNNKDVLALRQYLAA